MDSNILKERWKNYQTRYEYASNIDFEDLSHFIKLAEINTDGFEIVKDALSKKDISFKNTHCHVCGSDNGTFQKGEGELIISDDTIALVCHSCKKSIWF